MTITQVSHIDTLTNRKETHHVTDKKFALPDSATEFFDWDLGVGMLSQRQMDALDSFGTIPMHIEPEPEPEKPTNGLDEFIDWDGLERSLLAGGFRCQQDFRAQVQAQFEAVERPFSRGWYRAVVKGLFPEYREIYSRLPAHMEMVA